MKKITKADLIESVYAESGIEKKITQRAVDSFLKSLKESLEKGNIIELRGFGTFEPRLRKGREKARNPKTGEEVFVKPHYVAAFRAGRELKNNLWNLSFEERKSAVESDILEKVFTEQSPDVLQNSSKKPV